MAMAGRRADRNGGEGQGCGRRQVFRLFRFQPEDQGPAIAPRPGSAARLSRRHPCFGSRRAPRCQRDASGRSQDPIGVRHRRSGQARRRRLLETVRLAWRSRLATSLQNDLMGRLKERADAEAIQVFAKNLKDLLLAAPAGARVTMGLDPGFRTGVKVAVVDATGKLLATDTVYPHEPKNAWRGALASLAALCLRHKVALISIGNGTASRETDKFAAELIAKLPHSTPSKVMVSEAGASVYSASALAAREF